MNSDNSDPIQVKDQIPDFDPDWEEKSARVMAEFMTEQEQNSDWYLGGKSDMDTAYDQYIHLVSGEIEGWTRRETGNYTTSVDGINSTVFNAGAGWSWVISQDRERHFSPMTYQDPVRATNDANDIIRELRSSGKSWREIMR